MDTIGPLPEDEEGYKYILVVIDCFTRWVNLHPIKDTTAVECAKRMIHHVGTFGCPTQVQTDQGSQFESNLMEELFQVIGIHHLVNLAYSKEENAIVERVNKEVMRHLRGIIFKYNEIAQ